VSSGRKKREKRETCMITIASIWICHIHITYIYIEREREIPLFWKMNSDELAIHQSISSLFPALFFPTPSCYIA
jgi:hypothetical protein